MGNKGRKKSRMYLTAKEWNEEWGGAKTAEEARFQRMRYDHCSISFQPMKEPVAAPDGTCFDKETILQYLDKYGTHPRTGEPLKVGDLFSLVFNKNSDGEDCCPITMKVFNDHSHLVAIRTTGRVYHFDAVNEMNIKFKNFRDLVDDTPFTKKDIICIQDPHNIEKYNAAAYHHIQNNLTLQDDDGSEEEGVSHIQATPAIQRVLATLQPKAEPPPPTAPEPPGPQEPAPQPAAAPEAPEAPKDTTARPKPAAAVPTTTRTIAYKPEPAQERKPLYTTLPQGPQYAAASCTTTAATPLRKDRKVPLTEDQIRDLVHAHVRLYSLKAYVRLHTTLGELNLELNPHAAPKACENFITHCAAGYYNRTVFHRSIRNFMIQGGDPKGDGTGGESIYGDPFEDEFFDPRLSHEGKGILAMANSGPNTNRSQFYVTYKSAKHLDKKHTIFGKVVGGFETLAKMEKAKTNDQDRPLDDIVLLTAEVFADPYAAAREEVLRKAAEEQGVVDPALEETRKRTREEYEKKAQWFSNPQSGFTAPVPLKSGVGKYLSTDADSVLDKPPKRAQQDADVRPPPKPAPASSKWDFSSW
eukprot:EG_transcript_6327